MTIRRATHQDVAGLTTLFRAIHEQHVQALPQYFVDSRSDKPFGDRIRAVMADPEAIVLVADVHDSVIGFVSAFVRTPQANPLAVNKSHVYVDAVVVSADRRRLGVGTRLMREVEHWALDQGLDEVVLDVWDCNHDAIQTYDALGYRILIRRMSKNVRQGG